MLKIRPLVRRRFPSALWLESLDDDWWVDASNHGIAATLRLHNTATGHFVDIYSDGVQEFRHPGTIVLKEQLSLVGHTVHREVLADRRLAYGVASRF
jgi:hypothetical protein